MAQFLNAVVTFYCFYFFRQQRETASVAVCNIPLGVVCIKSTFRISTVVSLLS